MLRKDAPMLANMRMRKDAILMMPDLNSPVLFRARAVVVAIFDAMLTRCRCRALLTLDALIAAVERRLFFLLLMRLRHVVYAPLPAELFYAP